jgi:hypothetical protein
MSVRDRSTVLTRGSPLGEIGGYLRRTIVAAIVHEDDLQAEIPASKYIHRPLVGKQDDVFFV